MGRLRRSVSLCRSRNLLGHTALKGPRHVARGWRLFASPGTGRSDRAQSPERATAARLNDEAPPPPRWGWKNMFDLYRGFRFAPPPATCLSPFGATCREPASAPLHPGLRPASRLLGRHGPVAAGGAVARGVGRKVELHQRPEGHVEGIAPGGAVD